MQFNLVKNRKYLFYIIFLLSNGVNVHYACHVFDKMKQKSRKMFPARTRVDSDNIISVRANLICARARAGRIKTHSNAVTGYQDNEPRTGGLLKSEVLPLHLVVKLIFL